RAAGLGLKDVYSAIESSTHRHAALDRGCGICHVYAAIKRNRVWEVGSPYRQTETIFLIQGLSIDRKYSIEANAKDDSGNKARPQTVEVSSLNIAAAVENSGRPPVILSASIDDMRQTTFMEAVIRWETDAPTNGMLEYGPTSKYGDMVSNERTFVREHVLRISGLDAGKKYHYRITSVDIFGNAAVSGDYTLDTRDVFKRTSSGGRDLQIKRTGSAPQILDVKVFRVKGGKDVYLKIITDIPVQAYMRINEPSEMDKHGFGLQPARYSTIDTCIRCHPQGISHPVGVRSRGDVQIPPGLPTIEGGLMTCTTCHYPHSSNTAYLVRLDPQKDLCDACHKNKI
ncbi:MAG: hypothetical protein HZB84_08985, partial [Deltaproteobacteria bacterium]|nr:hypothetical protein [Deltaproteobacteria bacterium]